MREREKSDHFSNKNSSFPSRQSVIVWFKFRNDKSIENDKDAENDVNFQGKIDHEIPNKKIPKIDFQLQF